jgi:2-polyprenyl-3-methyl-5-hydroxy-6-metoxy-1,4-benzoquinol methylase
MAGEQIPQALEPVWPLPFDGSMSRETFLAEIRKFDAWHYDFRFDNGLSFSAELGQAKMTVEQAERPLLRFRHFMPYCVQAVGGSLAGKRVLDIACNSGFWSLQCALLGATVVGFDARPELIEQAELMKSAVHGELDIDFRVLDFWEMTPSALGGKFDVVLNLGILYHLPDPFEALRRTLAMTHRSVLLDTTVNPLNAALVHLSWENAEKILDNAEAGVIAVPTVSAVELMLRHLGASSIAQIPVRQQPMPPDYLSGFRASWSIDA